MTIHSDIPDSDVDPESPGTTTLFTRLRDNPLAIAEGDPTAPPIIGLDPIGEVVVSSPVAQVDFQDGVSGIVFDGTYDSYTVECINVVPDTDDVQLYMRVFAGAVLQTSATAYYSNSVSGLDSKIGLTVPSIGVGSASGEGFDGKFDIYKPSSTTQHKRMRGNIVYTDIIGSIIIRELGGAYLITASAIDGLRFYFSSGNIESGIFRLYGTRK